MSEPCSVCLSFLVPGQNQEAAAQGCCPVCFGLWDKEYLQQRLQKAIILACEPYGGFVNMPSNHFSADKDPPIVSLPGDVIFRYHMASKLPQFQKTAKAITTMVHALKNHANDQLMACIGTLEQEQQQKINSKEISPKTSTTTYPDSVRLEEQGYLALNIVLTTPTTIPRPFLGNLANENTKKRRRKQYETQGGHPRSNMERKLHLDESVAALWTVNHAMELAEKDRLKPLRDDWFVEKPDYKGDTNAKKNTSMKTIPVSNREDAVQVRVALWRRSFLVKGNYTKTRRDVSQTPFFVDGDNPKKKQRLGVTSIEELILPPLVELSGGIAECNNSPDGDNVVFGKAKFHASGREDMDVRMILPNIAQSDDSISNSASNNISGRPFCLEIIDALRMPTVQDLEQMLHSINHTGPTPTVDQQSALLPESTQYYGRSPQGVGVDPKTLTFAKGEEFKNLQNETEEKHKFYGCLCWSEEILPPSDELRRRLTTTPSSSEEKGKSLFPLVLQQRTPIRVLHRRANAVRIRHILSAHQVDRLDDHYFRLHISTDAGTYVKEYCHGDLGRTLPNVGTLLNCGKTDILELDCEGIQIN